MEIINAMGQTSKAAKAVSDRKYYLANLAAVKASNQAWKKANRERHLANSARWQKENPERCRINKRRSQKKCAGTKRANVAKYRAAKSQRVPAWADLQAITDFYKACPPGMTVDHVIPLRGKTVSGLHVVDNLQYLSLSENSSKGARF